MSDSEVRRRVIADAIWEHFMDALNGNLPTAAKALMAEEDLMAAADDLVEALHAAGLTVVEREAS